MNQQELFERLSAMKWREQETHSVTTRYFAALTRTNKKATLRAVSRVSVEYGCLDSIQSYDLTIDIEGELVHCEQNANANSASPLARLFVPKIMASEAEEERAAAERARQSVHEEAERRKRLLEEL